ncbi:uncharacterized protein LOC142659864 [Rhinoderma darwinii]|uniref:uncharacterized protein LOC142659864 n=1 Tax=Rhinoderma darwinii TaxID=43563 RepID=UPI003F6762C9
MKIATTFPLLLACLLHVTWGGSSDSCTEISGLPIDLSQINGLWNMKAIASHEPLPTQDEIHYSYAKISLTEKEGTVTGYFNPLQRIERGPFIIERVYDEKKTLAYRNVAHDEFGLLTFLQVHPDVLIVNHRTKELIPLSVLYVRSSTHPELQLEHFKKWIKCKDLTHLQEFNITVDYAQKCYGLFEENKFLEETEDNFTSWHLLAKSSNSMDQHYNVRILYTARLEVSRKQGEYTLKEIITAPADTILSELKFGNSIEDGDIVLTFKTEDDLLLLGAQTKTRKTLYLASRTPTVKQSVINKFKAQTVCFETKYHYFIPGSIKEDDEGDETCANKLEMKVPINFRESVGKWILTASAHEDTVTALNDILSSYGATEITVVNDKVHLSHTAIYHGSISTMEDIDVEESTGHIIYKDTPSGTRAAIHSVSPNCIIFSPEGQRLFLNCRAKHFPSIGDISQFLKYATCRNHNKILIRQPASYLCSEMPAEVHTLDVEKIAGSWKLAAVASNIPDGDVNFPNEIQFTVNNGEVTVTDGNWTSTALKIENRRLQYAKGDEHAMEMRFHEPLGDSLLTWVGNTKEHKIFLVLFSKSGHAKPDDLTKFKHFAACLSIRVAFLKE